MTEGAFTRRRPREYDGTSPAEIAVFEATEKLLEERSLKDLTVAQILEGAGLSRANFYHYFANKYGVVVALLSRLLDESYSENAPWDADPGRTRARTMGGSLERTFDMWTQHGAVICAVIEHMHTEPMVAQAWRYTYGRFVDTVAEQIQYERERGAAPAGPDPQLLAALLVSGAERAFYVSSRGLDPLLPSPADVLAPLAALNDAAIYGDRHRHGAGRAGPSGDPPVVPAPAEPAPPNPDLESETARSILTAMTELLEERTLAEISVAKILARAGISRASFYFYFRSKEDAFVELFRFAAQEVVGGIADIGAVAPDDPAAFAELVQEWLKLDAVHSAVIRNAVHEWPRLPELRTAYLEAIAAMERVFTETIVAARAGRPDRGLPAGTLAATLVWTVERTVAGSLAGEEHLLDLNEVAAALGSVLHAAFLSQR